MKSSAATDVVRLVDLQRLHAPIRAEIDAAMARVVDGGSFVLGDEVDVFESEIARAVGVPHAVAVSSGSDALLCLLWAEGIGKGDEVIVPAFTFVSPAEAVVRAGATPVFVDVGEDFLIDPASARAHVTERTRAILAVDLFGQRANFDALKGISHDRESRSAAGFEAKPVGGLGGGAPDLDRRERIVLLEDAAQAIGAGVGKGVRSAALSFFPTKNLGALGDGGMVLTEHAEIAERVRILRVHGSRERYVHERVGWNMRLDTIQAAVLRAKLPHLEAWNASRTRIAAMIRAGLAGVDGLALPATDRGANARHVWHQLVVRACSGRDVLRAALAKRGIETAVHYPLALHLQPCFAHLGGREGDHPNAERATREALSIPVHPTLTDDEVMRVIDNTRRFFER